MIKPTGGLYGASELESWGKFPQHGVLHSSMTAWTAGRVERAQTHCDYAYRDLGPQQARLIQMSRNNGALSPRRFSFLRTLLPLVPRINYLRLPL